MLRKSLKRLFSQINNYPTPFRPVQERVMSTSSWPTPYYHRAYKAFPIESPRKFDLDGRSEELTDDDVISLKFKMELDPKKRHIMEAFENNIQTDSKCRISNNNPSNEDSVRRRGSDGRGVR